MAAALYCMLRWECSVVISRLHQMVGFLQMFARVQEFERASHA